MNSAIRGAALACSALVLVSGTALAAPPPDQVDQSILAHARLIMDARAPNLNAFTPAVAGIDTVPNFQGSFDARGVDPSGNPQSSWPWDMLGNSPAAGGTTTIAAPVIPVAVSLLDAQGQQRYVDGHRLYLSPGANVGRALQSPVFAKDWHTLLAPQVKQARVMSVPLGSYRFALHADGSCCDFVLIADTVFTSLLFPPTFPFDDSTVIGAAELAGDMTTTSLATLLFQDTYLYSNGDPTQCCVLGFHSFDFEPGVAANGNLPRAYVMDYSSWISPGRFSGGFQDVAALSHEMAETFNDPLVGAFSSTGGACGGAGQPICLNTTPWWLAGGNCQDSLEVGDVIEGLPNATFTVTMNGFTYHGQNEALLQWFAFERHPDSLGGAYSYPDPSVLPRLSTPQRAGCTGRLRPGG
ncbi:MAG: hypothetical protein E6K36_18060 [Gammaproteobacteria bacterium]|nr:MAG: hypothetical protein E6K36_18060 [Gammaproteobacteria bacterium]